MSDEFEGEGPDNLDEPPSFFPYDGGPPEREHVSFGELVEVSLRGVFLHDDKGQVSQYVLLTDGDRNLPILIGPFEASAILYVLENKAPDRPLTHDLVRNILDRLGATVQRAFIDDYWNGVYYAKLTLQTGSGEIEIDARPSDAIALAVRFEASIFVADGILAAAMEE
jgi:uncharacterized protein